MDTQKVITQRRSIRQFQDKVIPQKTIEEILELTTKSPSGKNRQPWRFVVLQDKGKNTLVEIMTQVITLRKQQNLDIGSCESTINAIKQAPLLILVFNPFSNLEKDYNHFRLLTDTQSIGAAIQTMILSAQDLGLGSLWICDIFYSQYEICTWLNRTDELVAAVALGYPNEMPYSRLRKSLEEITEWIK